MAIHLSHWPFISTNFQQIKGSLLHSSKLHISIPKGKAPNKMKLKQNDILKWHQKDSIRNSFLEVASLSNLTHSNSTTKVPVSFLCRPITTEDIFSSKSFSFYFAFSFRLAVEPPKDGATVSGSNYPLWVGGCALVIAASIGIYYWNTKEN